MFKTAAIIFLIVIIYISLGVSHNFCQQGRFDEGLDSVDIGPGASVLIPKGARIDDKDGVLKVEGAKSFAGRKFADVEKRLDKLEKNQVEFEKKIEGLYVIITELQKNKPIAGVPAGHER